MISLWLAKVHIIIPSSGWSPFDWLKDIPLSHYQEWFSHWLAKVHTIILSSGLILPLVGYSTYHYLIFRDDSPIGWLQYIPLSYLQGWFSHWLATVHTIILSSGMILPLVGYSTYHYLIFRDDSPIGWLKYIPLSYLQGWFSHWLVKVHTIILSSGMILPLVG